VSTDPAPQSASGRVDYYLPIPGGAAVGVKLREGYLEIKRRDRELGEFHPHPRVHGYVEHWQKWRYTLDETRGVTLGRHRLDEPWVRVIKQRALLRYTVTAGGGVVRVPPGQRPIRACHLELAEISVRRARWWTLCCEARADEALLEQTFFDIAERVLTRGNPPRLQPAESFGYPRWLDDYV
jgi:hypothetical protein